MKFDMVRFEKGQIWEIYFKDKNEPKGREQSKNRPWIILSTRKFNESAGMVTAAPITTRDAIVTPSQVLFTNMEGRNNVILCEQMRTFDYKSGSYVFEYMGCVSDEVIEMLDQALSVHLGLKFAPSTLDRLYQSIESIMRSLDMSKSKINEDKFTDDDVLKFAEKLESLVAKPDISSITIHNTGMPDMDRFQELEDPQEEPEENYPYHPDNVLYNSKVDKSPKESNEVSSCQKKSKHRKWTKEMCEEFLKDIESLPMKEVMTKWDMSKKTRVYSMKHYVQELLKK